LEGFHYSNGVNSSYFVMANIVDVLFVGGFGTVKWLFPKDYSEAEPDAVVKNNFTATLQALNEEFSEAMARHIVNGADDVAFISADKRGAEMRIRMGAEDFIHRIPFKQMCFNANDIAVQLENIINEAKANEVGTIESN